MQIQQTILLNTDQIKTTLTNLFKIMKYESTNIIYTGKPKFSKEDVIKYNLGHNITKFAKNYTVYECHLGKEHQDFKLFGIEYMYYIVIEENNFDKLHIQACSWFYHLFENKILPKGDHPVQVFISPAYVVTDQMKLHVPTNVLPCPYAFIPLTVFYPIIGSKTNIYGLAFDYQLIRKNDKIQNVNDTLKLSYPVIYTHDPIVKILNGMVGDLIVCKRIIFDVRPCTEYYCRQIKDEKSSPSVNNI
jgi:hypothetical protein